MIKVEVLDSYMEQFENNKTRSFVLEERSKALIGVSNFTSFVRIQVARTKDMKVIILSFNSTGRKHNLMNYMVYLQQMLEHSNMNHDNL